MADYPECVLCDSKVSEVCGKWYIARGKKPPCAKAVVENCHSLQQLKAEIAACLDGAVYSHTGGVYIIDSLAYVKLRQLSAV